MRVRRRPLAAAAVLVLTAVTGETPGAARRDRGSLAFADAVIAAHRPSPAEDDRAVRCSDLPRATAQPTLERFEGVEPHMGTLVSITVFAPDAATARVAFRAGFDRIRELNEVLSDYLPDSELSRVTREGVRRPVPLSADLFAVLEASHRLSVATGGAFDVTQGPVIRLQEAAARSGDAHMHLDEAHRTVSFDIAGMQLDVGAIGKGFAASEALAAITRTGVRRALVAVSGDLAFGDPPPGQPGWRIRIHDGNIGDTSIPAVLRLSNLAVSTSGNAEQHLDVDGRRYSHVIDPSSRVGLLDDITVTVISRHGVDADGLDTAIGVLGVERGLALVDRDREAAALIVLRKAGTTHVQASRRLRELVTRQPPVDAARPR
jgi:thiamine biosynthesis lipoprotein